MTKVTILGEEPKKTNLKPITFIGYLMENMMSEPNEDIKPSEKPNMFKEIQLIKHDGHYLTDLFRCTKEDGSVWFMIGHFNDGVVI